MWYVDLVLVDGATRRNAAKSAQTYKNSLPTIPSTSILARILSSLSRAFL